MPKKISSAFIVKAKIQLSEVFVKENEEFFVEIAVDLLRLSILKGT